MEADSKVLSPPGLTHGIKRKERPEEDIDPGLVGGPRTTEEQLPPQKRRGSAINTPKIEQLNLSDRRNSIGVSGAAGLSGAHPFAACDYSVLNEKRVDVGKHSHPDCCVARAWRAASFGS